LLMALLIWFAFAVPLAVAVGRMLAAPAVPRPPVPPAVRPPAGNLTGR
jgi:hypothetical protein